MTRSGSQRRQNKKTHDHNGVTILPGLQPPPTPADKNDSPIEIPPAMRAQMLAMGVDPQEIDDFSAELTVKTERTLSALEAGEIEALPVDKFLEQFLGQDDLDQADLRIFQVRADIARAKPPIWRRLELRSDQTLEELHWALQAAFGWHANHQWFFAYGTHPRETSMIYREPEQGESPEYSASVVTVGSLLATKGAHVEYCYNNDANMSVTLKVEDSWPGLESAPRAECTGGRRAAPADDGQLVDAADAAHFDIGHINALLASQESSLTQWWAHLAPEDYQEDLARELAAMAEQQETNLWDDADIARAVAPVSWILQQAAAGIPARDLTILSDDFIIEALTYFHELGMTWINPGNLPILVATLGMSGLLEQAGPHLTLTSLGQEALADPLILWGVLIAAPIDLLDGEFSAASLASMALAAGFTIATRRAGSLENNLDQILTDLEMSGISVSRYAAITMIIVALSLKPTSTDKPGSISSVAKFVASMWLNLPVPFDPEAL